MAGSPKPKSEKRTLTPEEIRTASVAGIDELLSRFVINRFISAEQHRLLLSQRRFWQEADDATIQKLLTFYEQEP